MKRIFKVLLGILLAISVVLAGGYLYLWKALEADINQQIDTVWQDAQNGGVVITGEKPVVEGFPGIPKIHFQGTITDATGMVMTCPDITYSGYPFPGSLMKLDLPAGITVSGEQLPQPVTISEAHLYIRLPYDLPRGAEETEIRAWQQRGGVIPVESLHIKTDLLDIDGSGTVNLDDNLQLAGLLNTRIVGLDAMLADLAEKGIIQGKNAMMAQSFLQMLIQHDPVTNESYVQTAIRIQNRGVFLGPLRVASLPELFWNSDSQPVRRR